MTIGPDIEEVLRDVGSSFQIHPIGAAAVAGGFLDMESYFDHSTPFIRQYFFSIDLSYTTTVIPGNIISFAGRYYLVTQMTPSYFEDALIQYTSIVYRCNIFAGIFHRFDENPGRDGNYERLPNWTPIYSDVIGLHVEERFGSQLAEFEEVLKVPIKHDILYVSGDYDLKIGDRWMPKVGEQWEVQQIYFRQLDNVKIVHLAVDKRA